MAEDSWPGLYVLEGKTPVPVEDIIEWGRRMGEQRNQRHVALYESPCVRVSTVFLGLDHNFFGGDPLLFETMIFGGPHDGYQRRYSTWDEAVEGHQEALMMATRPRNG